MTDLAERLDRIEAMLATLVQQRTQKDYYSTAEVAEAVGRDIFTVRQWANLGRIRAEKRPSGRGAHKEWMIPHDELLRIQSEGLLPPAHRR